MDYTTAFDAEKLSAKLPQPVLQVSAPDQVRAGSSVTAEVSATGAGTDGEIVVLETPQAATWTPITSARFDTHGRATLTFLPGAESTAYRVRISATTEHKAATSDVVAITVADAEAAGPETTPEPSEAEAPSSALCNGVAPVRTDGRRWVCTYDDEFEGSTLDRRYWVAQVSKGSEFYTGTTAAPACVIDDPSTISQDDGFLHLNAVVLDEPISCGSKSSRLASGSVTHHGTFSQTYGKFEVRAKLPDWKGKGYQETFWLWPNNAYKYGVEHPVSGEIDFAEFYSTYYALTVPVMHYLLNVATVDYSTNTNIYTSFACGIRYGEHNTYGVEWDPGQMRILVNGQVCITNNYTASNATAEKPDIPFDAPFFLSLTQAFGAAGNEFDPATAPKVEGTTVDYVRIWK